MKKIFETKEFERFFYEIFIDLIDRTLSVINKSAGWCNKHLFARTLVKSRKIQEIYWTIQLNYQSKHNYLISADKQINLDGSAAFSQVGASFQLQAAVHTEHGIVLGRDSGPTKWLTVGFTFFRNKVANQLMIYMNGA